MQVPEDEFKAFQQYFPICLNMTSIAIYSDEFGTPCNYVDIYFTKWVGDNFWGTPTEIQSYLADIEVFLITLNSYYDEKDISFL